MEPRPFGMILLLLLRILTTITVITERVWLPLATYGLAEVAMTLGADGIVGVKARYLAVAIALFIPAAIGLTKTRRTTTAAALRAYTLIGVWYGTHVLAVGGLTSIPGRLVDSAFGRGSGCSVV